MRDLDSILNPRLLLQRISLWDAAWCVRASRLQRWALLTRLLCLVSRAGNGVFWYALMSVFPLTYGSYGLRASLHMAAVGLVCLLLYRVLKTRTARPRPCDVLQSVRPATAPLDRFSFPSGHTLHAVGFTCTTSAYFPDLLLPLSLFTALVALSRPALGLHYPSDVLAGGLLGGGIALLSLSLYPNV